MTNKTSILFNYRRIIQYIAYFLPNYPLTLSIFTFEYGVSISINNVFMHQYISKNREDLHSNIASTAVILGIRILHLTGSGPPDLGSEEITNNA